MAKRKRRIMVAYSGDINDVLRNVLFDALSYEAATVIAAYLQAARSSDRRVNQEVDAFRAALVEAFGGEWELSKLHDELGL